MKAFLLTISLLIVSTFSFSQSIEPKYTLNVELGLPVSTANRPFDDIMQGLVDVSLYGQYSFPFHLNIGLGAHYTLFTIDEFSVPSPVFGSVHNAAGFLKLGWDKYHNDRLATDFHCKFGYGLNISDTWWMENEDGLDVRVDHMQEIQSYYIEPSMALILSASENSAFSWRIGYGIQGYSFLPSTIGLQSNEGYEEADLKAPTQYLIVGFGYTYYFNGRKD